MTSDIAHKVEKKDGETLGLKTGIQRKIEIEDFINQDIEIDTDVEIRKFSSDKDKQDQVKEYAERTAKKIDLNMKLMDFANIKIPTIEPKIKKEIEQLLSSARKKLNELKSTFLA